MRFESLGAATVAKGALHGKTFDQRRVGAHFFPLQDFEQKAWKVRAEPPARNARRV